MAFSALPASVGISNLGLQCAPAFRSPRLSQIPSGPQRSRIGTRAGLCGDSVLEAPEKSEQRM